MSGGEYVNCQNSPWVQRAKLFISNANNPREQVETVKFLLTNGHYGINNRISIDAILTYLKNQGINLNREGFQNSVLTELKRRGIVASLVYPGPQGGIFIPCDVSEIQQVSTQVFERVIQELRNLQGSATGTQVEYLISVLRELTELFKRLI